MPGRLATGRAGNVLGTPEAATVEEVLEGDHGRHGGETPNTVYAYSIWFAVVAVKPPVVVQLASR
jgi:hypothetical protein